MAAKSKKQREAPSVETLEHELRQVLSRHHAARRDGVVVPERLLLEESTDRKGRLTRVTLFLSDLSVRGDDGLTARQHEVLSLIVDGVQSRDIAARLGVAIKTIEAHRAHIMRRLGVKNIASLVRVALSHHLVRVRRDEP